MREAGPAPGPAARGAAAPPRTVAEFRYPSAEDRETTSSAPIETIDIEQVELRDRQLPQTPSDLALGTTHRGVDRQGGEQSLGAPERQVGAGVVLQAAQRSAEREV